MVSPDAGCACRYDIRCRVMVNEADKQNVPRSWILLARWCGVYSWRIDGLWALPRHIKKWGSTTEVHDVVGKTKYHGIIETSKTKCENVFSRTIGVNQA